MNLNYYVRHYSVISMSLTFQLCQLLTSAKNALGREEEDCKENFGAATAFKANSDARPSRAFPARGFLGGDLQRAVAGGGVRPPVLQHAPLLNPQGMGGATIVVDQPAGTVPWGGVVLWLA